MESSMESILQFWQQIITDEEIPVQNRMKASELLYRSLQQEKPQRENTPALPPDMQELTARIQKAQTIIQKYAKEERKRSACGN